MGWIIALIVGGIAGWLASLVMNRDASMGIFWNIVVGSFLIHRTDAAWRWDGTRRVATGVATSSGHVVGRVCLLLLLLLLFLLLFLQQ